MIVYSPAFLNYIYSGSIVLLGSVVTLSVEARIEHLKENSSFGKCGLFMLIDLIL